MAMNEQDLPGIGRRFEIAVGRGRRLVLVVHHSGRRDIYLVGKQDEDPLWSLELTDDQARRAGAILGGAYFKPAVVEEIEDIVGEFVVDWITLSEGDICVGQTLRQLRVRQQTGMSVIAIVRGKTTITGPDPDEVLKIGDKIVVVGRHEDLPRLIAHLQTQL